MATRAVFPSVRSEGGLLPPDLLQRIVEADADLGGFAPADYGLGPRDRLGEAISRAWQHARAFWAAFRAATEELPSTATGVTETRDQWILPLLRALGYQPQFHAAAEQVGDRRYLISHREARLPIHIVSFRQPLDGAAPGAEGQRRMSPHALVQEYLNRSDGTLYGLVTNGLELRLLRDSYSLTRLSYVAFDLQAMLEGGVYADFALLWLALHRTRLPSGGQPTAENAAADVEPPGATPSTSPASTSCWLEKWRERAETQGTRAMGELRRGVEQALCELGTGLLAHPANEALRTRLRDGELTTLGFYQQLLRLLYRLLFLLVVEERDLLLGAGASVAERQRYTRFYSLTRLRDLTRRYLDDERHDDLWRALLLVFDCVAGRKAGLGIPPLGGALFGVEAGPDVDGCLLSNAHLIRAVSALSTVRVQKRWRRVNYRDMDVEELGGIYEGLLDRQPRVVVDVESPRFELVGSGERKQTGSYYTPSNLVTELIKSALDPVIADRLQGARTAAEREAALLRLTVCDAAAGSGHFLLAAARRIAAELARVRTGDREPSPAEIRHALRDSIRHCVYGVDLNPLAVDLCKLTLWLEGHEAGRPLSFLDHRIKLGNSLVGATPDLVAKGIPDGAFDPVAGDDRKLASEIKKRNKQERDGQLSFATDVMAWSTLRDELGLEALEIADLPEDAVGQVAEQSARYLAFREQRIAPAALPLDLWTAAFFWPLAAGEPSAPSTADVWSGSASGLLRLSRDQERELQHLRQVNHFFHWPLEFPEVFADGGFDCVLGNPPWERIKLQEQEFFAERDPAIATAANKAARQKLIDSLPQRDPALSRAFGEAKRTAEGQSKFVRASGRMPLTAVGDVNLYSLFAEHDCSMINDRGRAGVLVPTGISTDETNSAFFGDLVRKHNLTQMFDFKNSEGLFPTVDANMRFCLLTIAAKPVASSVFAFFIADVEQLRNHDRVLEIPADLIALLNPNSHTCPSFWTRFDLELAHKIYQRIPVLFLENEPGGNPWSVSFLRMFDMSNDSKLFRTEKGEGYVRLYEAKMFHHYNHRYASSGQPNGAQHIRGTSEYFSFDDLVDQTRYSDARYFVKESDVDYRLHGYPFNWFIAFRNVTGVVANERTFVCTALPKL